MHRSKAFGICVVVASYGVAGEPPAKPTPNSADEPKAAAFSYAKAGEALDRAGLNWLAERKCASCHTTYPYVMARPLLDPKAAGFATTRKFLEDRVAGWDKGGHKAGLPKKDDEAVTEIVATAATLAFDDARGGTLHLLSKQALDRMWTVQRKDGSWNWNKHNVPPLEHDEYFGVAYAALGVGYAPGGYAKGDSAKDGLERLRAYFAKNPPPDLHHKAWLAWASVRLDGLMTPAEREKTAKELLALQRDDGGWNLPGLGDWPRHSGQPNDKNAPSDGYATGFVLFALKELGTADTPAVKKGTGWLKANQRESGRWFTRSLSNDRAHYIANAGSAFAVMALKAWGAGEK